MSDKIFLKNYEKTITEFCIKNDRSKITGSESNKKIDNIKKKLNNPNKIIFNVEVPGDQKYKNEEKSQKNFHFKSEKNINNYNTINNINIFSENENLSLDLLQDYHKKFQDEENELDKEFGDLEDSFSGIFSNLGSNNPSFNKSIIINNNNNVNYPTENNVINHSISGDSQEFVTTNTIIFGKGLL